MRVSPVLSLFVLLAALSDCRTPTQPDPEPAQYRVPAEVEPYVQAFRDEARKRGQSVEVDNLMITFGPTGRPDVCGQCQLENGRTPRITLSPDAYCWKNAGIHERECLVLHELGHCLLRRTHTDSRLPNGAFVSLMNSSDVGVYGACVYPINNDACDKRPRRSYYLDELFDPATPTPAWAK